VLLAGRVWLDASVIVKEADGLVGGGRGMFFRSSRTFCDRSVFLMNHPAYRLPTVDSAMCTMSCVAVSLNVFYRPKRKRVHLIDIEVQVTRRDRLTLQKTRSFTSSNTTDAPTRLFQHHHLLHELFLIRIQEVCQFFGSKTGVELQKASECRYRLLGSDIGKEKV
jgi:hypothetical protein